MTSRKSIRSYIEMDTAQYTKPDLEILLEDLQAFCALVEERMQTPPAPEEPVQEEPPPVLL